MNDEMALALVEEQADASIRRELRDGAWYFAVVDVLAILTDSAAPLQYWRDTKARMRKLEGWNETQENILPLRLRAVDGKMRVTDAANHATILRIIQSIPSPKAEPIKQWLAKVGAERLQASQPATQTSVEVSSITKPLPDAPAMAWADYYESLSVLYRRQAAYEAQLAIVDARLDGIQDELESLHASVSILPEILERLGPQTLSPEHQSTTQEMVKRLHDVSGYAFSTIYTDLNRSFRVGKYSDIPDASWPDVAQWFNARIATAERRRT
jgi:hypothetical protein